MSSSFITALQAKRQGEPLNFEAAREACKKLTLEELPDEVLSIYVIGDDDEALEEARDFMIGWVNELEEMWNEDVSYVNVYDGIWGLDILVIGETTWGDTPEGFDAIMYTSNTPKISKALGLLPWTEKP